MIAILYVCHANMCRSPSLQGFLQTCIDRHQRSRFYHVDSCGLQPASTIDTKTLEAAAKKGVHLSHTPRALEFADFFVFDYILAATEEIQEILLLKMGSAKDKIFLATHFSKLYTDLDLPDPYALGLEGFNRLMEMIEESTLAFYNYLEQTHYS